MKARRVVVELTGPQATALAAAVLLGLEHDRRAWPGRLHAAGARALAKLNTAILQSRHAALQGGGITAFVKRRRRLDRGSR